MTDTIQNTSTPTDAEIQAEIAAGVAANKLVLVEGKHGGMIAFKTFLPGVSAERIAAYVGADPFVHVTSHRLVNISEGRTAGVSFPSLAEIIRHQQAIAHAEERRLDTLWLHYPGGEYNLWNNLGTVAHLAGVKLGPPAVPASRRMRP